jgi:hypothetical protein
MPHRCDMLGSGARGRRNRLETAQVPLGETVQGEWETPVTLAAAMKPPAGSLSNPLAVLGGWIGQHAPRAVGARRTAYREIPVIKRGSAQPGCILGSAVPGYRHTIF